MTPHEQEIVKAELQKAIAEVMHPSFSPHFMPKKKDLMCFILTRAKNNVAGKITDKCNIYLKKLAMVECPKALLEPEGKLLMEYCNEENLRNRILRNPDHLAIKLIPRIKSERSMTKLTYCLIRENRLELMELMYECNLLKIEEVHVQRTIGNKDRSILEFLFSKNLVHGDNLMYAASYQKEVEDKHSMQVYLLEKGVSILGSSEEMNSSPELDWIKEYARNLHSPINLEMTMNLIQNSQEIKMLI